MTALEPWASRAGQTGNDAKPPNPAVHPGRPERRVCARLQPFTAEVDPTRLSLLTVANAEMCMADEIAGRAALREFYRPPEAKGVRSGHKLTAAGARDPSFAPEQKIPARPRSIRSPEYWDRHLRHA